MNTRSRKPGVRVQNQMTHWFGWLMLMTSCCGALATGPADLRDDRAAVERVYYNHRLGEKPPFEQAMSQETLARLVRQDVDKEAALEKVYGIVVTPAQLEAEVQRINATTRAPEILAEIKAALGNDAGRFARAIARPILVERLLRERFDNDDRLHAPQRREVEQARNEVLAAKKGGASVDKLLALFKQSRSNAVTETTWQLAARPAEADKPNVDLAEIQKRFGPNAKVLSSPQADKEQKFYFEDLPAELQHVLRVQLRQAGDVSAVIEMPGGFVLYVAKERTTETLSVAMLSVPKRSYEQWIEDNKSEDGLPRLDDKSFKNQLDLPGKPLLP